MQEPSEFEFSLRPTVAEVKLSAISENFSGIKERVGASVKIMSVIKANAYGHGLARCAKHLSDLKTDYFGVAYIEEAVTIRKLGLSEPILVFGGIMTTQIKHYLDYQVDITAPSVAKIEAINEVAARLGVVARIHLKIDTGLQRLGVQHHSAQPLFEAALRAKSCRIVGVFSHFADVNPVDMSFTNLQLERFNYSIDWLLKRAETPILRHISASGAVIALPEADLDMVRPGLILFGLLPAPEFSGLFSLKPALTLKSQVVYFKVVKAGLGVSYGLTWRPESDTRIVTVPIGYGDGYPRALSNKGIVLIRGKRLPVVGRVCMDQLMVDISASGTAYNGDDVVLIGEQCGAVISAEEVAELQGTNSYEVVVQISNRVPRVYV